MLGCRATRRGTDAWFKSDSRRKESLWLHPSCLGITGHGVLKSKGVFKRLAALGAGIKNSSRGSLRTSKENPHELWSPATWDNDRDAWLLPPQQRGAQLEGWKQQPFVPACCFAYPITHWLGDKNKQDNTQPHPRRRGWRQSQSCSFLGMYVHTTYSQIEVLKKIVHATVRN